jgi:hypothetical protein
LPFCAAQELSGLYGPIKAYSSGFESGVRGHLAEFHPPFSLALAFSVVVPGKAFLKVVDKHVDINTSKDAAADCMSE